MAGRAPIDRPRTGVRRGDRKALGVEPRLRLQCRPDLHWDLYEVKRTPHRRRRAAVVRRGPELYLLAVRQLLHGRAGLRVDQPRGDRAAGRVPEDHAAGDGGKILPQGGRAVQPDRVPERRGELRLRVPERGQGERAGRRRRPGGDGGANPAALHRLRGTAAPVQDVAVLAGEFVEQEDLGPRGEALPRDERRAAPLHAGPDRRPARREGLAAEPADVGQAAARLRPRGKARRAARHLVRLLSTVSLLLAVLAVATWIVG